MHSMSSVAARRGAGWTGGRPALPAQSSTLFSPQRGSSWAEVRTLGAGAGWVAVSRQGKRGILHWVPDSLDVTGNFQINAPFSQRPPALSPMATLPLALPGRMACIHTHTHTRQPSGLRASQVTQTMEAPGPALGGPDLH